MTQFGQRRVSDPGLPGLFVDLYELTMASVYLDEGMDERASFSLFVRDLPPTRRFLLAAGLDAALTWLERMHFTDEDVAYIETLGHFSPMFLDWLRRFRFRGDVFAVPEGTPVFANEPLLEVEAGIAEAQLVETVLLNQMTVATLIASKGARVVLAAGDQPVIDFGTRRSHGTDAALVAARSLYLAGFAGTSNVQAGQI
ncbi:MAG: nicotinate phosphoribosyltransferase, partial [Dehalococcoidia bacterium]